MATDLISDQELKDLLEKDILELIGAQNLPQEKKEELYKTMADTVQNRTLARIYDTFNESEGQELDALVETGDHRKVDEYLKNKNIEITKLLIEEAVIYKAEMQDLFKKEGQNA